MSDKLGQEPAFPCEVGFGDGGMMESHQNGNTTALFNGMSKRLYLAAMAMQGILSGNNTSLQCDKSGNPCYPQNLTYNFKKIAINAYAIADELLKQEQDERKEP